ncbi:hypothetical protein NQ314_010584 [Rhamnusium bicolor]|uniref:Uncharacterized protein n=1 Tax=Rhamnusium bicolor TaxID=1586634 RepID=A0AAV8XQ79_9CUCU|nr:hypothetical protein NQ314_010584 [Rhamnusium bicolor]
MRKKSPSYIQHHNIDIEDPKTGKIQHGDWRGATELTSLAVSTQKSLYRKAKNVRNKYKEYYNSLGAVDFQHKFVY